MPTDPQDGDGPPIPKANGTSADGFSIGLAPGIVHAVLRPQRGRRPDWKEWGLISKRINY